MNCDAKTLKNDAYYSSESIQIYIESILHTACASGRHCQVLPEEGQASHSEEIYAFVDAIKKGKPSPIPGEEALITQKILDAIYESAGEAGTSPAAHCLDCGPWSGEDQYGR